jgi:NAD-dependent oxidoreductase involved in siderophore biosynthesis
VVKGNGVNPVARYLRALGDADAVAGLSDGQLLDRFVAQREEGSLEALVRRHGPMVWGVCRRVLRDHHDAEDACQATFLVLARKTGGKPIEYRQYLDVPSDDVRRPTYNVRVVVCEETVGKAPANLAPAEAAAFDRLLATKTFAVKDAPAADGRFPVVISHPGLNGTPEDNSALFEYRASHGYVVLSSAYPAPDAHSVKCGGDLPCSLRDLEFLTRYARELPFADADRLGAMGHSYGGWAVFAWAAEPDSSGRAFITLDSGLEYDTVESSGAESLQYPFLPP